MKNALYFALLGNWIFEFIWYLIFVICFLLKFLETIVAEMKLQVLNH